jgi:hypothetical protein
MARLISMIKNIPFAWFSGFCLSCALSNSNCGVTSDSLERDLTKVRGRKTVELVELR